MFRFFCAIFSCGLVAAAWGQSSTERTAGSPSGPASKPAAPANASDVLTLGKFEVTARQDAQLNSIDRKVYNVSQDLQSTSGSASDLLQNIPSVEVDIDGGVSLRGSDNVLILIDGHTSTLMGRKQADVLAQMPANTIERIEVITNPSAKYKPDGTAGIINIVLKRKSEPGASGTVTVNVGNEGRANTTVSFSARRHALNLTGSVGVRQDDRPRTASDVRTIVDPVTGAVTHADKHTVEASRPLSQLGRLALEYSPTDRNRFGVEGSYNLRRFSRYATDRNLVTDSTGSVTSDYDRTRYDPEFERSEEIAGTYRHRFNDPGHELNLEYRISNTHEGEPDHFTNTYRFPIQAPTFDNAILRNEERSHEAVVGYTRPLAADATFEAGYDYTSTGRDSDFLNEDFDPVTQRWVTDAAKTNHFVLDRTVHAFYATYARTLGAFAFMAGIRPEIEDTRSRLLTLNQVVTDDTTQLYPSLHLTYHLDERQEWQWNYSHRVHRADTDDLNPFPEYLDPFTLRAGNPHLRAEEIHSIETGYGYRQGDTSYTATAYYRYTYHGFTSVTTNLGNGVLLSTFENLAVNRAGGLEFTANRDFGPAFSLNASSNVFYNTIDASNLGYAASKSDLSWMGKAAATIRLSKATQLQLNTRYMSTRLTPQGERRPMYVTNFGARHELRGRKLILTLAVSDAFNSLKDERIVDTPLLQETTLRRRSARIVYLGFTYNFGQSSKKSKDDTLKFDESL